MKTDRYIRHTPLLDKQAWDRLCSTPIVSAGAGGLGSHILMSIVRLAPVTIEIWDPGVLDTPDLNRQILYVEEDIGMQKVEAAARRLKAVNSDITMYLKPLAISLENFSACSTLAAGITGIAGADTDPKTPFVLFDCLDSFEVRFELDAIRKAYNCPVFHGGVEGWFGQASTFLPGGKGFADLFGSDYAKMPKVAKPIMPQTVSAVASFQVGEYLHWCINPEKTPLSQALLAYNGLTMHTDIIELA
jgi:molybdopterin-synthase adenylyltransferase